MIRRGHVTVVCLLYDQGSLVQDQDQDQDSLLVKRRNDNHSPGPMIRELVPSSHQRSELSNTIEAYWANMGQLNRALTQLLSGCSAIIIIKDYFKRVTQLGSTKLIFLAVLQ